MGKRYILEIEENKDGGFAWSNFAPYTEPDAIRNEEYERAVRVAYENGLNDMHDEAYQKGLEDVWETVKKLYNLTFDEQATIFKTTSVRDIVRKYSASEAIEKIKAYEQKKQESITAEDVMRQYLSIFCKGRSCIGCPLHTPDFTCGRGKSFLYGNMSNEEVRRAYSAVLAKMKE